MILFLCYISYFYALMLMLLDYIASGPHLAALATSSSLMSVTRPQEAGRMTRVTARVTRAMVSVTPIRG